MIGIGQFSACRLRWRHPPGQFSRVIHIMCTDIGEILRALPVLLSTVMAAPCHKCALWRRKLARTAYRMVKTASKRSACRKIRAQISEISASKRGGPCAQHFGPDARNRPRRLSPLWFHPEFGGQPLAGNRRRTLCRSLACPNQFAFRMAKKRAEHCICWFPVPIRR